ncbi:CopG family transcriptional regulator [Acidobacteriota bacterium]
MEKKTLSLEISMELYDRLKAAASEAGVESVDDFVLKKLDEISGPKKDTLSDDDEEKVKARLKALGYMD